jgi:hypothetical protein
LRLDHHGQRPVIGFALDMPPSNADQLPEGVGVCRLGHLAQAEVDPFGKNDVHQSDPVGARRTRAQVGECFAEAGRSIHL